MTLRVGVQMPEVERDVRWPEYVAMARVAEEVGFDSIWIGDHLLYDDPERAPWEAGVDPMEGVVVHELSARTHHHIAENV